MRCEYMTTRGQCANDAISGTRFCPTHSTRSTATMINQYRIACKLLGDSPKRHAQADEIKNLKGEIAILRSALERRLNMIETDAELIAAMPTMKDFALALEKLATSCHNMDVKLGNLIDKQALMSLAQKMIGIIDKGLRDFVDTTPTNKQIDEAVEAIGQKIVTAIAEQENQLKK